MGFVFKFLKELNSSTSDKTLSLALVFGLISGFLPFFNIFNLIIIFIVLIIRIPIGLFIATSAVFSFVGYLLDPLFHKTGLFILHSFSGFWEYLYNLPIIRWSGFNNSIVMGSLVWGIFLGLILYFVLSKSIKLYREIVFSKLENSKYLKWIVPKKEKGIFRISGFVFVISITAVISLILILFLDPVIKFTLEYSLSKITKKPVYIESLKTSIKDLNFNITNMQIDKIKIEKINLDMSWYYLLWKKYDIKNLVVKNIYLNKNIQDLITAKQHTNNLNKKTNNNVKNITKKIPSPKEFLANYDLKSIKAIEKLKKDYKIVKSDISSFKNAIKSQKNEIELIKKDIKNLEKKVNNIKNLNDITSLLEEVENIKKRVKKINTDIKEYKSRLEKDKTLLTQDLNEIKKAANEDYNDISKKYKLLAKGDYNEFAQELLKPEFSKYLKIATKYYEKIKPYINNSKKDEEKYIRGKGVYVKFRDKIDYPDFVIEKANISGALKNAKININAYNISDNQKVLGKKALIKITSTSKFYNYALINIEYFKDIKINGFLKSFKIENINIKNILIKNGLLDSVFNIRLFNNQINGNIIFQIKKINMLSKNKKLNYLLKNINSAKVEVITNGLIEKPNIIIKSNLDKIISNALNKSINEYTKTKEFKKLIDNKISNELKNSGVSLNEIKSIQNLLNNNQKETKSLQNIINKYSKEFLQKKLLKDSSKNLLKGLF